MTKRESRLLAFLAALLVVGGGYFVGYSYFWKPYSELRTQINTLQDDVDQKEGRLAQARAREKTILTKSPWLAKWRELSLPPAVVPPPEKLKELGWTPEQFKTFHQERVRVDYDRYLVSLFRDNGFSSIKIDARRNQAAANPRGRKKAAPAFEPFTFTVQGKGKVGSVVRLLEDFHSTPLLHQVKSLSVARPRTTSSSRFSRFGRFGGRFGRFGRGEPPPEPAGDGQDGADGQGEQGRERDEDLQLTMTVEALMVAGAKPRLDENGLPLLIPKEAPEYMVLAEKRDYSALRAKDMFNGIPAPPSQLSEAQAEVLGVVKLTTLFHNGIRWEAHLYDQGKGGAEIHLDTFLKDEIEIYDKYGSLTFAAKVAHIDGGQLILRSEDRFYQIGLGDFLYPAIEYPLSDRELEELGLSRPTPEASKPESGS